MAKRLREQTAPAPEERLEEESEEGSTVAEKKKIRGRVAAAVRGIGEVPAPPGVWQVTV